MTALSFTSAHSLSHKQVYCCEECAFLDRIKPMSSGCIEWQGNCNYDGYGVIRAHGTMMGTHRFSYEYYKGEIPDGLLVCHTCDNPRCVNPEHLFLGTYLDNNRDRVRKGRNGKREWTQEDHDKASLRLRGEGSPRHKLTEADVLEMREMREKTGISFAKIAALYGVRKSTCMNAIKGKTWSFV